MRLVTFNKNPDTSSKFTGTKGGGGGGAQLSVISRGFIYTPELHNPKGNSY